MGKEDECREVEHKEKVSRGCGVWRKTKYTMRRILSQKVDKGGHTL
jgi:hypothetical protein